MTIELTPFQWNIVRAIAIELVLEDIRVSRNSKKSKKLGTLAEIGKVNDYLSLYGNNKNQFFEYLQTLVDEGKKIGHSGITPEYYKNIEFICSKRLGSYQDDINLIRHIMEWAFRLMSYYEESFSTAELKEMLFDLEEVLKVSDRQAEIAKAIAANSYEVGQVLEAKITNKKTRGKMITYTINNLPTTQKDKKIFDKLEIGQSVQVEILVLRDDGKIKKVKCLS